MPLLRRFLETYCLDTSNLDLAQGQVNRPKRTESGVTLSSGDWLDASKQGRVDARAAAGLLVCSLVVRGTFPAAKISSTSPFNPCIRFAAPGLPTIVWARLRRLCLSDCVHELVQALAVERGSSSPSAADVVSAPTALAGHAARKWIPRKPKPFALPEVDS